MKGSMLVKLFGKIPYEGNTVNPEIICILDTKILYNYNSTSNPFSSKNEYDFYGKNFLDAGIYAGEDVLFIGATNRVTPEVYDKDKLLGEVIKECKDTIANICAHYKPKLVIAIGKTGARQAFGKSVKITEARGIPAYSSFLRCPVFPLFGFGQVMRNPDQQEYYLADMLTLKRLIANNYDINESLVKRTVDYQWCTDLSFLIKNPPKQMVVDCETVGLEWFRKNFKLLTVQLCYEAGKAIVVPLNYPLYYKTYGNLSSLHKQRLRNQLRTLLRNPNIEFIGHNLKFDFHAIRARLGVKIANFAHDTLLMLHTLNENMTRKSLDEGVRMFVPEMSGFNDQHNKDEEHQGKSRMDLLSPEKLLEYGAGDVDGCFQLYHELSNRLKEDPRSYNYYKNIVIPAIRTFADVEVNGFYIDEEALRAFEKKLEIHQKAECQWLLNAIPASIKRLHENTGVGLKPDRSVILIDYLFNHPDGLRLKPLVFTKTSTADNPIPSVSTKDHLPYFEHIEFVTRLQDYVKNQKLLTTYVSGFYKYINNGRIRPTYSLHKTVTSRSASENPNGQNFPKRGPLAKEYRKIFVCPEGWVLLEADYSQIEIKLAAIYANEKNMLNIFKNNGDIHMATAAGVMGISLEEFKQLPPDVRKIKRTQAKAVVFGFIYGMWWKKFKTYAKTQYGIEFTDKEAEDTRKAFFKTYPGIEVWHSEVQRIAKKQGFVRSFSGRKRHLPNVNSSDEMAAKEACRQGINAPVQELGNSLGLASISILNNKVSHDSLRLCGYIHDAIVFLSRKEDAMKNINIIKTCMENLPLKELFNFNSPIKFTTGISIGYNLSEMHEIENESIYKDTRVKTSDDIIKYLTTPPRVVIKKKRNRLNGV